jgi:hypothetical protein
MPSSSPLYIAVVCFICFLGACGKPSSSTLNYAIGDAKSTVGGVHGRFELSKAGLTDQFDQQTICIEVGIDSISKANALFEVKLAFAVWLSAAGYGQEEFDSLLFLLKSKCFHKDNQYDTVVQFTSFKSEVSGEDLRGRFNQPTINCERNQLNATCTSPVLTLGWGGPGGLYFDRLQSGAIERNSISRSFPSWISLSPYIKWVSIDQNLAAEFNFLDAKKLEINNQLKSMSSESTWSFINLVNFSEMLASESLIFSGDPIFAAESEKFMASNQKYFHQNIQPVFGAYHTLLHELGHTFGLRHADNPLPGSITGQSPDTHWDETRGQYLTSRASMAYSDLFAYLTEDDQRGVRASVDSVRKYVNGKP